MKVDLINSETKWSLAGLLLTFRLSGEAKGILTDKMENGNCNPKFNYFIGATTMDGIEG